MSNQLSHREQRKRKTKESVKKAALEIATIKGWNAVTIRNIAEEIQYAPPVVYEHFKNKEDLLLHITKDGFNQLLEETKSSVNPDMSPEDQLRKFAEIRFDFAVNHRTLHQLMFDVNNSELIKNELISAMEAIKEVLLGILKQITGDIERVKNHFIQIVCMIIGFTFMNNVILDKYPTNHFESEGRELKPVFMDMVEMLIEGMKR